MGILLRAEIVIDMAADNFIDAAQHQKRVEDLLSVIRSEYGDAQLQFRERRPRDPRTLPKRGALRHYTGSVKGYED